MSSSVLMILHLLIGGQQGVRAVIAESFEKLHKNQLVGMGIMPLEFLPGENAESLELSGKEKFTITLPDTLSPREQLTVTVGNRLSTLRLSETCLFVLSICTQDSLETFSKFYEVI